MSEAKSWVSEKTNKPDKPLGNIIKIKNKG